MKTCLPRVETGGVGAAELAVGGGEGGSMGDRGTVCIEICTHTGCIYIHVQIRYSR